MFVAAYIRVNSEKRSGLEVQKKAIEAFCKEKGYEIQDWYIDYDNTKVRQEDWPVFLPEMERLFIVAKAHLQPPIGRKYRSSKAKPAFGCIVALRFERLARNLREHLNVEKDALRTRIGFYFVEGFGGTEPIDVCARHTLWIMEEWRRTGGTLIDPKRQ